MKKCSFFIITILIIFTLNGCQPSTNINDTQIRWKEDDTIVATADTFDEIEEEIEIIEEEEELADEPDDIEYETIDDLPDYDYAPKSVAATAKTAQAKPTKTPAPEKTPKPDTTPKPTKAPQSSIQKSGATVYVTNSGKRFHRATCGSLSKSKIPILYEEAIDQGYTACGTCKP